MTVSRVLRGLPGASEATRARVERLAQQYGYRRDARVSELMRSFRKQQGAPYLEPVAVLQHTLHRHWETTLQEVAPFAKELGYRLDTVYVSKSTNPSERTQAILRARGIRGVLILPGMQDIRSGFQLNWADFACVVIGSSFLQDGLPRVRADHFQLVSECVRQLLRSNCQNIGMAISQELDERSGNRMSGAFLAAKHPRTAGKTARSLRLFGDWDVKPILKWIELMKCDALIVHHSEHYEALKQAAPELIANLQVGVLSLGTHDNKLSGMRENHELIFQNGLQLLSLMLQSRKSGLDRSAPILHVPGFWCPGTP